MRITLLTSSYPRFPGDGTAPFVRSIAEALQRVGHAVEVVAPDDPAVLPDDRPGPRVHRFRYVWPRRWHIMGHARSLHADVRLRPATYLLLPLFLLAEFLTLWRVSAAQGAEIIYAHWVLPNGPAAALVARLRRVPLIISLHGSDLFIARRNRWFGAVARWCFQQAAAVTAPSPEMQQAALGLGAPPNTLLLPWGADPRVFHPQAGGFDPRARFGLPPQTPLVTALGRMVHKKGFDVLLRAWAQIASRHPTARLILAGDGDLLPRLRALAEELGVAAQVHFPGRTSWDHVPGLLAGSDLFVLPSRSDPRGNLDGLPTVLLEAMSCGLPVIASRVAGVPLVIRAGENGLLVPPGDAPALAEALDRLLSAPAERKRFGAAARRSVEQTFNWDTVAEELSRCFSAARAADRARKAAKIRAVLRDHLGADLRGLRCLDLGCGDGGILRALAPDFALAIGADLHTQPSPGAGAAVTQADGARLPFPAESFDVVICAQVYEHAADPEALLAEIRRLLRPDGVVYLSGPNRLALIEEHYHLPLLSWLPRRLADAYMRLTRRGHSYNIRPRTWWGLRRLLRGFMIHDATPQLLAAPQRYHVDDRLPLRLPRWLGWLLRPWVPNFNWVLKVDDRPRTAVSRLSPNDYTQEYYLTECDGYEEFLATRGTDLPARLALPLEIADIHSNERVLDLGCGRGELAWRCAHRGAFAWGLDYAPAALTLARSLPAQPRLAFGRADLTALPIASETFNLAFLLDVVEHLTPDQLRAALQEAHRALKPGGRLIVHTMPNTWYYRWGYPLYRWVQSARGQNLPRDPRARWGYSHLHVNEQSPLRLRAALRACGFQTRVWLRSTQDYQQETNPLARAVMRLLTRLPGLRLIFCNDIFAVGIKPR